MAVSADLFRCPLCQQAPLSGVANGPLECTACGKTFPLVRDVRRFVDSQHYSASFGYQWNRFARTQLDSAHGTTRSRDAFVQKTGWPLPDLQGKLVLDAGCGMGRYAEVCAEAGAEVVGFDLSHSVEAAHGNLAGRANVTICQADVFAPPFRAGSFDYIYSIGVLDHTPDTRRAFLSLVPLLKPGGRIAIWVYSKHLAKLFPGSKWIRPVTSRLPARVLMQLCRLAVPLYHVHRIPYVGAVTSMLVPTSMDVTPEWRVLDTFDWYSPRYHSMHALEEVQGWFAEAGLTDLVAGPFLVSVSGRRPA
jgi:SAM-dependent methyltransferase